MHMAYVSTYNARNILNWSGTALHMAEAFQNQNIKVDFIDHLHEYVSHIVSLKRFVYKGVFCKTYFVDREPRVAKHYARQAKEKLIGIKSDVIFSPGTIPIAYLESEKPIVFWTDATFAGMINYYPSYSNLCEETIVNGNKMEQLALSRCKLALYSSDWAAKTAIDNYMVDCNKVKVVSFGANIKCNKSLEDVKNIVKKRNPSICKLLFIGKEWERKGGDVALRVAEELNRNDIRTELTIVGRGPDNQRELPNYVKVTGFLDKNRPENEKLIEGFIAESHFLVLPSRAEASAIVFCEANSFGVPCVTTDVGGTSTIIRNGVNGQTFSLNASISEYCEFISDYFGDGCRYEELALASYNEYRTRLNWDVAGQRVRKLIEEYCF